MTLKPGTQLGQYEVRELIGAGGMGEVYRAHDTQLKRDVALKVLPEQFSRDSDRLARFRREAELLASLNHPNIAAIYGIYSEGNRNCLVMELVPGDTLHQRVQRDGAVPLEESLDIAKQICDALEHAHEKTVIHRDLKPANVKLTPEGKVKVLDFGLAKAFAADGSSGETPKAYLDSNSPTLTSPPELMASPTLPGVILGTAAYMSPEQAKGKTVDRRTDIWALGCVLYELLTGKQVFTGESATEILGAIHHKEPDWTALPETTPPGIRALLRRCLQKDLNRRLRGAADISIALEDALNTPTLTPVAIPVRPMWRRSIPLVLTAVVAAIITGLVVWNLVSTPPATPRTVAHVVIDLLPDEQLSNLNVPAVAFSPDGSHIAYVGSRGGSQRQLYLRAMDSLEATPISGTEGAHTPFFSPDGQWVGFVAQNTLKKVSISGGAPASLANALLVRGASWGPNDTIIFSSGGGGGGILVIPASGGEPEALTALDTTKGEQRHRWPEFLPDGKAVLFDVWTEYRTGGDALIVVESLETGERRVLIEGGSHPHYVPTGHLVYAREGSLMAVPFDLARLELTGTPVSILEGILESAGDTSPQFSFSRDGSLVYVPGGITGTGQTLAWVDREGMVEPLTAPPRAYQSPRLSPDGRNVALRIRGEGGDNIWVYDIARTTLTRLTFEGSNNTPLWTPDGERVTFSSSRSGRFNLFWKLADGSGEAERLTTSEHNQWFASWSPDGQTLAFTEFTPTTGADIWILPVEGERQPRPFLRTPFNESEPMFSPDGRWLAYTSNESGQNEIYVQPYPNPGRKWPISSEGGNRPMWSRNGRELFYVSGDPMMAVDTTTQPTFSAGTPRLLFEVGDMSSSGILGNYDVAPDGQRFLMVMTGDENVVTQFNVVLNWFEELKSKVPVQ